MNSITKCERCSLDAPVQYVVEFNSLENGATFMVCFSCAREARSLKAFVYSLEVWAAL